MAFHQETDGVWNLDLSWTLNLPPQNRHPHIQWRCHAPHTIAAATYVFTHVRTYVRIYGTYKEVPDRNCTLTTRSCCCICAVACFVWFGRRGLNCPSLLVYSLAPFVSLACRGVRAAGLTTIVNFTPCAVIVFSYAPAC